MAKGAVLITGSSTGIGEACALHLDGLGFRVFAGVRREADGEKLVAQASGALTPVILDVADDASVTAAAKQVDEAVGAAGLVGLVNNAGVARGGPIEHLPLEEWRSQFDVNVFGQLAVTQATLPMIRRGGGRIVFMGSIAGRLAQPLIGPYVASKHAIEGIGDVLRMELAPWGIHVAVVEPGAINTPIWEKGRKTSVEMKQRLGSAVVEQYRSQLDKVDKGIDVNERRGAPPQKVADAVEHALTARRPKTRYLVGADAKLGAQLTRFLPDRLTDRLLARLAG